MSRYKNNGFPEKSPPPLAEALMPAITAGDLSQAREMIDQAFWRNALEKPSWDNVKLCLLKSNKPMLRLLLTWGAEVTPENLTELKATDGEKFPQYVQLLRQAGLRAKTAELAAAFNDVRKPTEKSGAGESTFINESLRDWPIKMFIDDAFIDHRIGLMPKEWRALLKALHKEAPEALIAGGALRDFFGDKPVKDVDIFLASRGSERKARKFLAKAFDAAGLKITRQRVEVQGAYSLAYDDREFPDPRNGIFCERKEIGYGDFLPETTAQSWTVIAGKGKTEFNIVFLDGPFAIKMKEFAGTPIAAERLMHTFDFSLCQIACDGKEIHTTSDYRKDVAEKTIRLITQNRGSQEHLQRIVAKYGDWQRCPETEKALNPPKRQVALSPDPFY